MQPCRDASSSSADTRAIMTNAAYSMAVSVGWAITSRAWMGDCRPYLFLHSPASGDRMTLKTPAQAAPSADIRPVTPHRHGVDLVDDYGWLRAANWQEALRDPAVLAAGHHRHLVAENAYAEEALAPLKPLIDAMVGEMRGASRRTMPASRRRRALSNITIATARAASTPSSAAARAMPMAAAQIMLDGDALAAGKAFFDLGGATHSSDHGKLAGSYDDTGSEFFTLRIRDLATGDDLVDVIEETGGDAVWSSDGSALYYIRLDENHRPLRIFRHVVGVDSQDDALIFEERTPRSSSAWARRRRADLPSSPARRAIPLRPGARPHRPVVRALARPAAPRRHQGLSRLPS